MDTCWVRGWLRHAPFAEVCKGEISYAFKAELITSEKRGVGWQKGPRRQARAVEAMKETARGPRRRPISYWCYTSFHATPPWKLRGQNMRQSNDLLCQFIFFPSASPWLLCTAAAAVKDGGTHEIKQLWGGGSKLLVLFLFFFHITLYLHEIHEGAFYTALCILEIILYKHQNERRRQE